MPITYRSIPIVASCSLLRSFSFDGWIFEAVMALCQGASLYMHSQRHILAGDELECFVAAHRITHAILPPIVTATLAPSSRLESIRTLILSGDRLPIEIARKWEGGRRLINGYGPTETTVCATLHDFEFEALGDPPIGKPIANKRIYILDRYGEPVPTGVIGELYIGGVGVARGYLNRPELTAERFVADSFVGGTARMYRTGDLGRWLPNGNIEFAGRSDDQVKIRGFRIEPSEIEAHIASYPTVREAAVIVREDEPGEKRLVAYYTQWPDKTVKLDGLRAQLRSALPEHMVPAAYVMLEIFPLTPNGKLDRRALPIPEGDAYGRHEYEPPEGEIERALARLWEELIGVKRAGRRDHFFKLGGHSLLAVRFVDRAAQCGLNVSLADLFESPTIDGLAACIASGRARTREASALALRASAAGDERPLFLVHDGMGLLLYAHMLAPLLNVDMSVYGLPALTFDDTSTDLVERSASKMIEMMRAVQPKGPYRIAGWSFGGLLAYEIGAQLLDQQESVEFLGLLDAPHSMHGYCSPQHIAIQSMSESQTPEKRIGVSYRARPAALPVNLFVARERVDARRTIDEWSGIVLAGRLEASYVSGTHHSMIQQPHIEELGTALSKAIDEAAGQAYALASVDELLD
jgi:pristinamycin I synthase-3/4